MRTQLRWLAVGLLLLSCGPVLANGNANFLLGGRALDEDEWEPLDKQGVFGVTVDFGGAEWPVHMEAGFYGSAESDTTFDSSLFDEVSMAVAEFCFGVNKTWSTSGGTRPFVGGGIASVAAGVDVNPLFAPSFDDDDESLGFYVHGGVFWRLGPRFNIGIDARVLTGTDLTLFNTDTDVDYVQLGLVLGFGWPGSK